jgi:sugar (pentulose or hexulose) kinase
MTGPGVGTAPCAVGVDVGSTWVKALAIAPTGEHLATARRPTPWHTLPGGGTQTTAAELSRSVSGLLVELDAELSGRPVASIGISGMAESGVLLDADGNEAAPVPAWFDPRGGDLFQTQPGDLRAAFPAATGLPVSSLATFAKLLDLRSRGLDLGGLTWLNVPEYVAHVLGAERYGEVSLVARTGLLDQGTAQPWDPALAALGVDASLLPPLRAAGSTWGRASRVPASMADAVLTVAGHDHLVASVGAGVVHPHQLYDSIGTAEALVRVLAEPLPPERRAVLAAAGVNVVRHLLPGRFTMLAGLRTGLVLRRVLNLVGVHDEAGRDALDAAVLALPSATDPALVVSGADNTVSSMTVRVDTDDVSPAALFAAALDHATDVLTGVVALIDAEAGPATETVVAGGWSRMASVRRARETALRGVVFSSRDEDTAHGAALIGAFAADPAAHDLADALSSAQSTRATHPPTTLTGGSA